MHHPLYSNETFKAQALERLQDMVERFCASLTSVFESPIEAALFEACALWHLLHYGCLPAVGDASGEHWKITPQTAVGSYRLDFLIEVHGMAVKAAVECDGHEYHERTKEQAQRDRSRDREMQSRGYLVLRYTGSEIYREPWACACDIAAKLAEAEWRSNAA